MEQYVDFSLMILIKKYNWSFHSKLLLKNPVIPFPNVKPLYINVYFPWFKKCEKASAYEFSKIITNILFFDK